MLTSDHSFLHLLERWFEGREAIDCFCCHIFTVYIPTTSRICLSWMYSLAICGVSWKQETDQPIGVGALPHVHVANMSPFFVRSRNTWIVLRVLRMCACTLSGQTRGQRTSQQRLAAAHDPSHGHHTSGRLEIYARIPVAQKL